MALTSPKDFQVETDKTAELIEKLEFELSRQKANRIKINPERPDRFTVSVRIEGHYTSAEEKKAVVQYCDDIGWVDVAFRKDYGTDANHRRITYAYFTGETPVPEKS